VEKLEGRMGILGRENELLKHQLKKYVGAVQKLRDGQQVRVQTNFWDLFIQTFFTCFLLDGLNFNLVYDF
jgi:hypothetical protein